MKKKIKRTFGLAVLLKLARISPKEQGGVYEIPNPREVSRRLARVVDGYGIKLLVN